jgi:hypothetical protein
VERELADFQNAVVVPTPITRGSSAPTVAPVPKSSELPRVSVLPGPPAALLPTAPPSSRLEGVMRDWRSASPPGSVYPPAPTARPIATPVPDADPFSAPAREREQRAEALETQDEGALEALALYRSIIVEDPSRVDIIGKAFTLARRAGFERESRVAASVLTLADHAVAAPGALTLDRSTFEAEADVVFRNPAHAAARRLLRLVWESNVSALRTSLADLGVLGTDRIGPHHTSALGHALGESVYLTPAGETGVFFVRGSDRVRIARTQPAAVLYGELAENDASTLRFFLGRAFELASPEHILVSGSTREEGELLLTGIRAAFGPAEGERVPREAAELASDLWRTMAPRAQREVQELLVENESTFEWDSLHASFYGGAARLGLVASADITASLRALAREEGAVLGTSKALAEAIAASGPLSDVVRFVFGDLFIDAIHIG